MEINAQIRIWSDTAANFTAANPTLAQGQWAKETDTGKVKLGDGSTAWNSLAYSSTSYEEGVWTPSFTGFSANPTCTGSYTRIGNICIALYQQTASGTSNATTKTITLPFTAANTGVQNLLIGIVNNGTFSDSPGRIATRSNSNIADVYRVISNGTAWTNTGTCGFANFVFTYEIQD